MTTEPDRDFNHPPPGETDWYEIEVEGLVHPSWFSWLDGWTTTSLPDGNTLLEGRVIDQPALHGLFACIRDMNLKIISLKKNSHSPSSKTCREGYEDDYENQ